MKANWDAYNQPVEEMTTQTPTPRRRNRPDTWAQDRIESLEAELAVLQRDIAGYADIYAKQEARRKADVRKCAELFHPMHEAFLAKRIRAAFPDCFNA